MSSRVDCGAPQERSRARSAVAVVLAIVCVVIGGAGCDHDSTPKCAAGQFRVTVALEVNRVDVSLLNRGSACRFSGTAPVFLRSALRAQRPPNAHGRVPAGATFVQPFAADEGSTCPANLGGNYRLQVQVEGTTVTLTDLPSRQLAPSLDACMALSPLPAFVRPPNGS